MAKQTGENYFRQINITSKSSFIHAVKDCKMPVVESATLSSRYFAGIGTRIVRPSIKSIDRKSNWITNSISRPYGRQPESVPSCKILNKLNKRKSVPICKGNYVQEVLIRRRISIGVTFCGLLALLSLSRADRSLAGPFSFFLENEKDPIEPFTIYGSIFKKYLIEDIVDGRIVGRRKGFTASVCLNIVKETQETPLLQSLPAGMKLSVNGDPYCVKGLGQSREASCARPCENACQVIIGRHIQAIREESGYVMEEKDRSKAQRLGKEFLSFYHFDCKSQSALGEYGLSNAGKERRCGWC